MRDSGHGALAEPFAGLFTQGMVVHETIRPRRLGLSRRHRIEAGDNGRRAFLIEDNLEIVIGPIEKMSKSKKNTVDPTTSSRAMAPTRRGCSCCRIRRPTAT